MARAVIAVLFVWLFTPPSLRATEWQAAQGDVARLVHSTQATVHVFDQAWPVRAKKNGYVAWVGIDLARAPGRYPALWSDGTREWLVVHKGNFRLSRITVRRDMAVFDAEQLQKIRHDQRLLRDSYRRKLPRHAPLPLSARPVEGIVSTPFGARRIVNGEPRAAHSGIDLAAPAGSDVRLPVDGTVLLTAAMYLNGNTVVVGHGDGLVEVFSHLRSISVHDGARLKAGAVIGEVGATGRATGPHLHWGIRFGGARVNPDALLPEHLRDG